MIRAIATGAVAQVFLVSDGRLVKAVKLFPVEHHRRAQSELSYGYGLDHPNLNPIEGEVEVSGYPGVIMPLAPGLRLGRWLQQNPDRTALVTTFIGVLEALGYLHRRGIIHRDVKPENIIVDPDGYARLLDFDLAVRIDEVAERQSLAGTVAYLNPEQARGEPVSVASDLYAAGVILYRAVTGEVPFTGTVEEVILAHRSERPPPVSSFDPDLAPFDFLVGSLLAKEPIKRQRRAHDVIVQLRGLEADTAETVG